MPFKYDRRSHIYFAEIIVGTARLDVLPASTSLLNCVWAYGVHELASIWRVWRRCSTGFPEVEMGRFKTFLSLGTGG